MPTGSLCPPVYFVSSCSVRYYPSSPACFPRYMSYLEPQYSIFFSSCVDVVLDCSLIYRYTPAFLASYVLPLPCRLFCVSHVIPRRTK